MARTRGLNLEAGRCQIVKYFFKFFIFIFMSTSFQSCVLFTQKLKDPEVQIVDLSVTNFTLDALDLNLKLHVKNPNDVDIKVKKIIYGLNLSGKPVTEGIFAQGAEIKAMGSSDVIVPLKFKYSTLGSIFNSLMNNNLSKEYELKGSVDLGWLSIPFTKKGEIKLK